MTEFIDSKIFIIIRNFTNICLLRGCLDNFGDTLDFFFCHFLLLIIFTRDILNKSIRWCAPNIQTVLAVYKLQRG